MYKCKVYVLLSELTNKMANDALKERAVAEILEETKKAAARAEVCGNFFSDPILMFFLHFLSDWWFFSLEQTKTKY